LRERHSAAARASSNTLAKKSPRLNQSRRCEANNEYIFFTPDDEHDLDGNGPGIQRGC
jgi:hypothetical protein